MLAIPNTARAGLMLAITAFLISPGMIVIGRFATVSVFLLPMMVLAGQMILPRRGHWAAGLFLGFALLSFNTALSVMPIANAIAIFFVEPLILTLMSAVILGEKIGWRRISAVLVGLLGAIIVIRPNFEAYGVSALLPLAAAGFFACYMLVTRVMTQQGDRLALQFWTGISAMLFMLVASVLAGEFALQGLELAAPGQPEVILFLGMGVVAVITHQMIANALARLEASVVAPMQYLEIISAVIFGWWIFGDLPDLLTWLGGGIIIASGVYVFHRERQISGENV